MAEGWRTLCLAQRHRDSDRGEKESEQGTMCLRRIPGSWVKSSSRQDSYVASLRKLSHARPKMPDRHTLTTVPQFLRCPGHTPMMSCASRTCGRFEALARRRSHG